jgi:hypothetical protein
MLSTDTEKWQKHQRIISSGLQIIIFETFAHNFGIYIYIYIYIYISANKSDGLPEDITAHDIVPYFTPCSMTITVQTGFGYQTNV